MRALALILALGLAACATPAQKASACASAKQAADLAAVVLAVTCTSKSSKCDMAGAALKNANLAVRLMCPAP